MKDTLKKLRDSLTPIYGKGETEAIIRIIFHYLKGWSLTDMLIHENEPLSPFMKEEVDKILIRLLNNEPIQYITGEARFHGMEFHVVPGVLIPRPETDELTDIIIQENDSREDLKVLDIGTGSGCIAITLARFLKFPQVTAIDNSEIALKTALDNAKNLKANVNFLPEDIFKWKPAQDFDIIVSNPPYIDASEMKDMEKNVVDFEPHQALFVPDNDPLLYYKRIAEIAHSNLSENGTLYLEINPRHASEIKDLLSSNGINNARILSDSFGKKRFIIAKKS